MTSRPKSRIGALLLAVVLPVVCAASLDAQSFAASHAKVDLVAEDNTFQAGGTAWIGVRFDLEKGWHIYWENPGDSGEPPRVQWSLPAGFRAGEFRWPVPVRLGTGTVIDFGYQDRALFLVPLEIPASYKRGTPAPLAADVRYLICREVCIPAKAHIALSIPSGNGSPAEAAAQREMFRSARERLPQAMPATWKAQATDNGGHLVLSLETGSQEAKATFFPRDEDQIDNAAAQVANPSARGVQLTLKKSDQLLKPIAALRGVVVLRAGAFEIAAPVTPRR